MDLDVVIAMWTVKYITQQLHCIYTRLLLDYTYCSTVIILTRYGSQSMFAPLFLYTSIASILFILQRLHMCYWPTNASLITQTVRK